MKLSLPVVMYNPLTSFIFASSFAILPVSDEPDLIVTRAVKPELSDDCRPKTGMNFLINPARFILSNRLETVGVDSDVRLAISLSDARPSALNSFKIKMSMGSSFIM
jgi:hypothetical protein